MTDTHANFIPVEEYLGWGEREVRYEYVDGAVFAMSGGTRRHSSLKMAIGFQLFAAARGSACHVYDSDFRVQITRTRYYYPDLSVSCEPGNDSDTTELNPCLVVEVLSPSTEQTDRREKLVAYMNVPSLRHYLMVAQDEVRIDHYYRADDGPWNITICGPGDCLVLSCPSASVSVDDLFAAVSSLS